MNAVNMTSYLCNLPKLIDNSHTDENDLFLIEENTHSTFGADLIKKSDVYYMSKRGLFLIDVLVGCSNIRHHTQSNNHTGSLDTWYESDLKYYFMKGCKKVYLKDVINSPRQDEFILVDRYSKL